MKEVEVEIVLTGPCLGGCGGEGTERITVTSKLADYEHVVKTKRTELYCERCFMEKLTGLSIPDLKSHGLSSSSEE